MCSWIKAFCVAAAVAVAISPVTVFAAISIPFTVNLSEAVTVNTGGEHRGLLLMSAGSHVMPATRQAPAPLP